LAFWTSVHSSILAHFLATPASIFFGPILFICVLPVWDRAEGKWVPIVATVVLILTAIIRPRVNARYEAYKRHFMKNRLEVASDEEDELTK
jgi:hypothetical protein